VWKWLGFTQKVSAIRMLYKDFVIDVDYKNLTPATSGATINKSNIKTASPKCEAIIEQDKLSNDIIKKEKEEKWGGHNKQTIMLNIKCFKSLCLKAQTKKADEIIANIGGGYEKLELYINKNHKSLERSLMVRMIQNRESLETNVEALMNDKKLN
jgi:hypothetical protein